MVVSIWCDQWLPVVLRENGLLGIMCWPKDLKVRQIAETFYLIVVNGNEIFITTGDVANVALLFWKCNEIVDLQCSSWPSIASFADAMSLP
jgi:hypothetical protein